MATILEVFNSTPELQEIGQNNYQAIANWFNRRPVIPNPEPQPSVKKPLANVIELLSLMQAQSDVDLFSQALDFMNRQNQLGGIVEFERVATPSEFLQYLSGKGFTQNSRQAIIARLNETYPDPEWPSEVLGEPRYQSLGIRGPVTASDVQSVFN